MPGVVIAFPAQFTFNQRESPLAVRFVLFACHWNLSFSIVAPSPFPPLHSADTPSSWRVVFASWVEYVRSSSMLPLSDRGEGDETPSPRVKSTPKNSPSWRTYLFVHSSPACESVSTKMLQIATSTSVLNNSTFYWLRPEYVNYYFIRNVGGKKFLIFSENFCKYISSLIF